MADTDAANEREQGVAEEAQGYIPGCEANNVVVEAWHEEEEAYALEAETRRWVNGMIPPLPPLPPIQQGPRSADPAAGSNFEEESYDLDVMEEVQNAREWAAQLKGSNYAVKGLNASLDKIEKFARESYNVAAGNGDDDPVDPEPAPSASDRKKK